MASLLCVFFGVFSNHLNLNKHIHKIHTCKVSLQCVFFDGLSKHIHKIHICMAFLLYAFSDEFSNYSFVKMPCHTTHVKGISPVRVFWCLFKWEDFEKSYITKFTFVRLLSCMCPSVLFQICSV